MNALNSDKNSTKSSNVTTPEENEEDLENYKPGSFGCHELLDRTILAAEWVERTVLEHPSCSQDPEWRDLAEQAVSTLHTLYQRIGAKHLPES